MRIRPRLLLASLLAAVAMIAVVAWTQRPDDSGDDEADAVLDDPSAVITYPTGGLGNDAVAGDALPAVVLHDGDGNDVSTHELLGEPMVVNLWYSTCAPCAIELPEFAAVDAEFDEVRFIGVNPIDSVDVMERFAGERGVEYALYRDDRSELTDELGVVAFPVTLFVASDGTIVEQTGALDADQLRAKIGDLLEVEHGAT